jgi:hypothetical protein
MFQTGEYVNDGSSFTSKDWGTRTAEHVASISQMKQTRWVAILKAVGSALKEMKKKNERNLGPPPTANPREFAMPDSDPILSESEETE